MLWALVYIVLVPGQFDHLSPLPEVVETIEEKIERVALEHKVDPELALRIAKAESGFKPEAKNPLSTASGIYQFLDSTFERYCVREHKLTSSLTQKNDPAIQIECAMKMIAAGGLSHWQPSEHLWKKN